MYKVMAKVISQKGSCEAGHSIGDEFVIGQKAPAGICSWAFYTLFPFFYPPLSILQNSLPKHHSHLYSFTLKAVCCTLPADR